MRIAQIAPIVRSIPPQKHGGIERVIWELTENLVKKGNQVTLFATGDSQTSAKLVSVTPKAVSEHDLSYSSFLGVNVNVMNHIGSAYQLADQFDIIHDHCDYVSLPTAHFSKTPVLMTIHLPIVPGRKAIYETLTNPYLVTVSKSQGKNLRQLNYLGHVYNGLDMENYPFSSKAGDYLLYVGSIRENKGAHIAVKIAKSLDMPLIIAAKLHPTDHPYFEQKIKPYLSNKIRWIGEVDEKKRNRLMSKAYCFLHPLTWEEPFGLTLIEAMACGTPVVAFNLGSIPELIINGQTGFIADNFKQMLTAIKNIGSINRAECRKYVLSNFSAEKMTDDYLQIYNQMLARKHVTQPRNNFYLKPTPVFEKAFAQQVKKNLKEQD